ncbi:MAG: lysine--tRNA ligase [Candidatus Nezhaarchaeales archaeon]|nr:MAG: lysine--tRNA ligase [Candidatus Nezhaarchaeota archaeon WYZ-LMO8]
MQVKEHWLDEFVNTVLDRFKEHVVASGTSISGSAHIGNIADPLFAHAIAVEIRRRGGKAVALWVADDMDPLDSVPPPIPREFNRYLGMPYVDIPDPYKCCRSWAEHFTREFLDATEKLGLDVKYLSGAVMYRDGTYLPWIRMALEKAGNIRTILLRVSGTSKPSDWLPYMPVCENCGKIGTTYAYDFQGDKVLYECTMDVGYAKGCGYRGECDVKDGRGKLQWRVEWAARWAALNVTIEPFGKEHAAAGGSYDTSKVIVKDVFNKEPPIPLTYEHVMINGKKMSKSRGNIFTPQQWFEIAPPQALKFFFFRVHPMRHKDFRVEDLPSLMSEYERAERIYYGFEVVSDPKLMALAKRSYELSQVGEPGNVMPIQLPYDFAVVLVQLYPNISVERLLEILRLTGHIWREPTKEDIDRLVTRLNHASTWIKKYAPEGAKIKLLEDPSLISNVLSDNQKRALIKAAELLLEREWDVNELNNKFFELSRTLSLPPHEFFEAAYLALMGKKSGPRLVNFIAAMGREKVVRYFLAAATSAKSG